MVTAQARLSLDGPVAVAGLDKDVVVWSKAVGANLTVYARIDGQTLTVRSGLPSSASAALDIRVAVCGDLAVVVWPEANSLYGATYSRADGSVVCPRTKLEGAGAYLIADQILDVAGQTGSLIVAYQTDATTKNLFVRAYDPTTLAPNGPASRVNKPNSYADQQVVTSCPDGTYTVGWRACTQKRIVVRKFDANAQPLGVQSVVAPNEPYPATGLGPVVLPNAVLWFTDLAPGLGAVRFMPLDNDAVPQGTTKTVAQGVEVYGPQGWDLWHVAKTGGKFYLQFILGDGNYVVNYKVLNSVGDVIDSGTWPVDSPDDGDVAAFFNEVTPGILGQVAYLGDSGADVTYQTFEV